MILPNITTPSFIIGIQNIPILLNVTSFGNRHNIQSDELLRLTITSDFYGTFSELMRKRTEYTVSYVGTLQGK